MDLAELVKWAIICLVLILLLIIILIPLTHFVAARRGALPAEEQELIAGRLLESIRGALQNEQDRVSLGKFWRSTEKRYNRAQRYVMIRPLLRERILTQSEDSGAWGYFQTFFWNILHWPTSVVRVSQRTWVELVHGKTGKVIVKNVYAQQYVHENSGIAQSGDGAKARQVVNEADRDYYVTLVEAIRRDANKMGPAGAEGAEKLADDLDADVKQGDFDSAARRVDTLASVVASAATVWAATSQLLG